MPRLELLIHRHKIKFNRQTRGRYTCWIAVKKRLEALSVFAGGTEVNPKRKRESVNGMSRTKNRPENCEDLYLQTDDTHKPEALKAMAIGLESSTIPVILQVAVPGIMKKLLLKESQDRYEKMGLNLRREHKPSNNWTKRQLKGWLEGHPRTEEADIKFITTMLDYS